MSAVKGQETIQSENPLRIGTAKLGELDERLKAFRVMNQVSAKKRYIIGREALKRPGYDEFVLEKSKEIDVSVVKLLSRYFEPDKEIKIFQPDEGIVIVSDMSSPQGISFSMDIVTQIMNIGGGVYEGFIERIDSFGELLNLLKNVLFSRLLLIGYLPSERLEAEKINFIRAQRVDQYIRLVELTHSVYKKEPYFANLNKCRQIHIDPDDPYAWGRLIIEVIREYTRGYFIEDTK